MALVHTSLGDIDERDIEFRFFQASNSPDSWTFVHEGKYIGAQFPDAVGTVVRRDGWCVFKVGNAAAAAQPS